MARGRSKRCSLGKSCGATCISRLDVCEIELNGFTSESLTAFLSRVKSVVSKIKSATLTKVGTTKPKTSTDEDDEDADKGVINFDKAFVIKTKVTGSKSSFDWSHTHNNGFRVGQGGYGFATMVEAANGKPGYVVKRGQVSTTEAEILKKLGDAGIGPKLLYAETAKGKAKTEYAKSLVNGRIAMSIVPGSEIYMKDKAMDKVGNTTVGDSFWALRASLHRMGIAHNDAHNGNVMIDSSGKSRFIDLGLAQDNPKAALSEALGAFLYRSLMPPGGTAKPMDGDFQVRRQPQYGIGDLAKGKPIPNNLKTVSGNLPNVYDKLYEAGFSDKDIISLMKTGIRKPEKHFEKGLWGQISNEMAIDLINTLYQGV